MRAIEAFERDRKCGEIFPAFLFLSVTQRCQYACRGCWARGAEKPVDMDLELLRSVVRQCRDSGRRFFGIMGGEPLLVQGLVEELAAFHDCYFLLFTNGAALDAAMAARIRRAGNISPLISVEGDEAESDVRRGARNVFGRAMGAMDACRAARLPFGVASSICRSNLGTQATDDFVREVIARGAHYLWYYIYRPVGPDPAPELCLTRGQILGLRRFIVAARRRHPIVLVDAYWDAEGRALCPAATGISHHINALGDVEPCPPLQVAAERLGPGSDLRQVLTRSRFLAEFRAFAPTCTRGCVLLEAPEKLGEFVAGQGAAVRDSSSRGTVLREWDAMRVVPGHDLAGDEIRESSWAYRFAKRRWFFGFGAYG
jgi:MoaA/NifB/PqqE/SkfB family radical SAM enzyme